jgi:hypothetical protein
VTVPVTHFTVLLFAPGVLPSSGSPNGLPPRVPDPRSVHSRADGSNSSHQNGPVERYHRDIGYSIRAIPTSSLSYKQRTGNQRQRLRPTTIAVRKATTNKPQATVAAVLPTANLATDFALCASSVIDPLTGYSHEYEMSTNKFGQAPGPQPGSKPPRTNSVALLKVISHIPRLEPKPCSSSATGIFPTIRVPPT